MRITKAEFVTSGTKIVHLPTDNRLEVVFCGRSNVGKSSFINMLVNRKNLARTSSNPGKTQTLNFYMINDTFYFVDVPGYGYANVSKSLRESFGVMIEEYLKNRSNLKMAFLLVDFRHEPTNDDKLMFNYFKYYNIPVTVICTKADKVKKSQYLKNMSIIKKSLGVDTEKVVLTSSEEKKGLEETLEILEELVNSYE